MGSSRIAATLLAAALACANPDGASAKTLNAFDIFYECQGCPEMVAIPPGEFFMGSTPEGGEGQRQDEQPQHRVRIGAWFAIGRHEVTRAQFAAFVQASGYTAAAGCDVLDDEGDQRRFEETLSWRDPGFPQPDNDPVVCVTWADAVAYAAWLSGQTGARYRLPTESEWEYAARAGTTTARFWGDTWSAAVCNFANIHDLSSLTPEQIEEELEWGGIGLPECDDQHEFTAPVGSFLPNPWGLHDMLGNVWEWVQDCYAPSYDAGPQTELARPHVDCDYRVARGAGWDDTRDWVRAAQRLWSNPDLGYSDLGFRVARSF